MTPEQVLEEAKGRFIVLYHDDEPSLHRLLVQALGKYQEKAGCISTIWTHEKETRMDIPPHFLCIATAADVKGRRVNAIVMDMEDGDGKEIVFMPGSKCQPPYVLYYFLDLRNWDLDKELPHECISLLTDYLEALIAVYNTERQRTLFHAVAMPSSSELLSISELKSNIKEIELAMEDNKCIVPPQSYF